MIKSFAAAAVVILITGELIFMSNTEPIKILDTIQGSSFLAIQSAIKVLRRYKTSDLAQHKMEVLSDSGSVIVIFTDKDRRLGVKQGSDVEMNNNEFEILSSKKDQIETLDTIQGKNFLAVDAAVEVFQAHKPDLKNYKITVFSDNKSLVVMFTDKDTPKGARGSVGKYPGFEVELSAGDRRVLRSNFVR
jgi:hypothetical protein